MTTEKHKILLKALSEIMDKSDFEFWTWECTPMPIGMPLEDQYIEAIKMIFNQNG